MQAKMGGGREGLECAGLVGRGWGGGNWIVPIGSASQPANQPASIACFQNVNASTHNMDFGPGVWVAIYNWIKPENEWRILSLSLQLRVVRD